MLTIPDEGALIIATMAVYLGATFSTFFKSIVSDLFIPLLSFIIPIDAAGHITMTVNGRKYDVGQVLVETIHTVLAILLVYVTLSTLHMFAQPTNVFAGGAGKK